MITRLQLLEDYIKRMEANRRYLALSYYQAKIEAEENKNGEDMTEILQSVEYTKQVLIDFANDMDLLNFIKSNFSKIENPVISNSSILSLKKPEPKPVFEEPVIVDNELPIPEPVLVTKVPKKAKKTATKEAVPEPVVPVKASTKKKKQT